MPEYVKVNYPRRRNVFIDGTRNGYTNKLLRVSSRRMTFTLSEPPNYSPNSVTKIVKNTTVLNPLVIEFTPDHWGHDET